MTQLILIFTGVILITLLIGIYKSLSKLKGMSEQYWGNVQSQLQKKYDLISILTGFIKNHLEEGNDAANDLTEAKLKAMQSFTPFQKSLTEKQLDDSIDKIFELVESDTNLVNDEKFLKIKNDMNSVKTELMLSGNYYNAIVRDYNSKITSFPSSLVARMLGHYNKESFELDLNLQKTNEN